MVNLSRAQEREERTKMGRGLLISIFAVLFCWVPLLGLILSSTGFLKVFARITNTHRKRRVTYLTVTLLILILCTGVLMAEIFAYVDNPNVIADTGMWFYTKLTGQTQLPGQDDTYNYMGGVDYGSDSSGMGYDPSLYGVDGGEEPFDEEEDMEDWSEEGDEGDQGLGKPDSI